MSRVPHATEDQVMQECREMRDGTRDTLSDGAALAVASWYQSPGDGARFAELSTTGRMSDPQALSEDIRREKSKITDWEQRYALFALSFWIITTERGY